MKINQKTISLFCVIAIVALFFGPNEGLIINRSFWENDYLIMIFSILSYLIYTAFKRGMKLQQEQDLTI